MSLTAAAATFALLAFATFHAAPACAGQRAPARRTDQETAANRRHNELRLAQLEPGKDKLRKAIALFGPHYSRVVPDSRDSAAWVDGTGGRVVRIDTNREGVIDTITVSTIDSLLEQKGRPHSGAVSSRLLRTGRGLGLGDAASRALELYGAPNSRGPSTRGSRALEFLFYAFDWAGPEVPQVLEVYCDQQSGRVVEITLAAPTL